jgi:hypothetical protein
MATDYETYTSGSILAEQIKRMHETGWPKAQSAKIYLPEHEDADGDGNVWVIEADPGRYVRRDGFVR